MDDPSDDPVVLPAGKRRPSKKQLIIIGGVIALLVAIGIGAWLFFGQKDAADHAPETAAMGDPGETYVEVPPMLVNLRSSDGIGRIIKLRLTLVASSPETATEVTARLPRIVDSFQPFLRELRPDDLAGSAAVFRIKEELLVRANSVTGTGSVKQVLVQDLIQQ
jgi:flagellar FliL protein